MTPQGFLDRARAGDDEAAALRWTARVYTGMLESAKQKNKRKGCLLFVALGAEIIAIGFVALAVAHAI